MNSREMIYRLYGTPEGLRAFNQITFKRGVEYQYEILTELEIMIYGPSYSRHNWYVCDKLDIKTGAIEFISDWTLR